MNDHKEIENAHLLDAFATAVQNLSGSGAYGRSRYYELRETLLNKLNNAERGGTDVE